MPENPARPLPRWGIFNDDTNVLESTHLGGHVSYSLSVTAVGGEALADAGNWDVILAMPASAKRVLLNCRWTHTVTTTNATFTAVTASMFVSKDPGFPAAVTDFAFVAAPDTGGGTSQDYTVEWTRGVGATDWTGTREQVEAADPTSAASFCRWQMATSADALGVHTCTSVLTHEATIVEIELEDGTIYTPPAEFVPDGYRVGDGHNVPLDDLTELVPQPSSAGVKVTRRSHAPEPLIDAFKYVELVYSSLGGVTEYQAVLSQLGILSAIENEVTVTAKTETLGFQRFNGTAVRPQQGADINWSRYFPRQIIILVKYLAESD